MLYKLEKILKYPPTTKKKKINVDKCLRNVYLLDKRGHMKFFSVRDFRTNSNKIWSDLKVDGQAVVTVNGKPNAILVALNEDDFLDTIDAIKLAKRRIQRKRSQEIT